METSPTESVDDTHSRSTSAPYGGCAFWSWPCTRQSCVVSCRACSHWRRSLSLDAPRGSSRILDAGDGHFCNDTTGLHALQCHVKGEPQHVEALRPRFACLDLHICLCAHASASEVAVDALEIRCKGASPRR